MSTLGRLDIPVTIPVTFNFNVTADGPSAAIIRSLCRQGMTMQDILRQALESDDEFMSDLDRAVSHAVARAWASDLQFQKDMT